MSTIHGRSHKAIRFFREPPAALPVYWLYCARRNKEGIAWPSLRGLIHDTGWSQNPIRDARAWLVEHEALERVEKYIRPEWRKLPEKARRVKVGRDRSEYYRVTGIVVIEGVTYSMLYSPADDAEEDADNSAAPEESDVSRHDTSQRDTLPEGHVSAGDTSSGDTSRHDTSQRDTELDSIKELESMGEDGSSSSLVAEAAAASAAPDFQPVQEVVVVQETETPTVAIAATLTPGSEPPPLPQKAIDGWSAAYHQLEMQLGLAQFNPLLRDATLNGLETNDSGVEAFVIGVRTLYARDMLQNSFYRAVRRVLTDVYGSPVELRFEVNAPVSMPTLSNEGTLDNLFIPVPPKPATQAEIGTVFTHYANEIEKSLTPLIADDLKDLIQTCGTTAVDYGIDEAARHNKRSLSYVVAVAERKAGLRQ